MEVLCLKENIYFHVVVLKVEKQSYALDPVIAPEGLSGWQEEVP